MGEVQKQQDESDLRYATDLVDVEPDCGGGADAHIQDQGMTLRLQVVTQLLAQLLPWLLHRT